ncbi:hypothetical protein [Anaerosalibacter bizertensis]|uniref:hypothetical protein n=1 Tax=Anaerosalibacter bizertensis TaxID=932217 RepID=UPI003515D069
MILIEINIINFKEIFRKKYGYYNNLDMNVLKEYKDNILFYERKMNNSIKLYKFSKKDYNIELLADIERKGDAQKEYIDLDYVYNNKLYFSIGGDDLLSYYSYDLIEKKEELLFQGKYDFSIYLDDRYMILGRDIWESNIRKRYLYDLLERRVYEILDKKVYSIDYSETRKIVLNNEEYIVFNKRFLDSYELDEIYREGLECEEEKKSGIYVISFDKFLKGVKSNDEKLDWDLEIESREYSFIQSAIVDKKIQIDSLEESYRFIYMDLKRKLAKVYNIVWRGKLELEEVFEVSYSDYKDSYNLILEDFPLKLTKSTWFDDFDEYKVYYPEDYLFTSNDNEGLSYILDNIIINEKWEEPEGQYKDYTIIRDRFTLKILKIIEGIGLLLDHGNTLLIY